MYSLLLDSSNIKLAIGLAKDNELIDSIYYDAWQRQSEFMIQEIDSILKRNNLTPKDIGEIISSKGPGSYTGVRISLTIAKTWGLALNIPVYLVSSLGILKKDKELSICLINARSKRSYCGVYQNGTTIKEDSVISNDEVLAFINEKNPAVCGDSSYLGVQGYDANIFKNMLEIRLRTLPEENVLAIKPVYLKD